MPAKPHALMDLLVFGQMLASEEPIYAGVTVKSMPLLLTGFFGTLMQQHSFSLIHCIVFCNSANHISVLHLSD